MILNYKIIYHIIEEVIDRVIKMGANIFKIHVDYGKFWLIGLNIFYCYYKCQVLSIKNVSDFIKKTK